MTERVGSIEVEFGDMREHEGWRGWFTLRRGDEVLLMGATKRVAQHSFAASDAAKEIGLLAAQALRSARDDDELYDIAMDYQARYGL